MPYEAEISRRSPGCIMFLLDQSGSMNHKFAGENISKAQGAADAINRLLHELILKCTKEEGIRDYFDVAVIGYGSAPGFAGPLIDQKFQKLSWLGDNTVKVEERKRKVADGAGGLAEETVKFPIWFEPVASGDTPMCRALQIAQDWISKWIPSHPNAFPPLLFNITDGGATDGDPENMAKQIMDLSTSDGNVLLFNCHISEIPGGQILFPQNQNDLPPDKLARKLFEMSSELPELILNAAKEEGFNVAKGSRGFAFNADLVHLIRFIDIGTRVASELQ